MIKFLDLQKIIEVLSLPMSPVMIEEEVNYVIKIVNKWTY